VTQPVDSSILHEIVRIIDSRGKVPERVIVKSKEYVLTYLEDHQRRMEEALQRFDRDRLNMLYGQLASKIKYQLLRRVPARAAAAIGVTLKKPTKAAAAPKPAAKKPAKAAAKAKPPKPKSKPAASKARRKPAPKRAAKAKPRKAAAKKRR
jgi:hypothetical protein